MCVCVCVIAEIVRHLQHATLQLLGDLQQGHLGGRFEPWEVLGGVLSLHRGRSGVVGVVKVAMEGLRGRVHEPRWAPLDDHRKAEGPHEGPVGGKRRAKHLLGASECVQATMGCILQLGQYCGGRRPIPLLRACNSGASVVLPLT